jgi:hypothetical protein
MSDLAEVCPLSRGVMSSSPCAHGRSPLAQPLSSPFQAGLRFLRHPLPADPSAHLAARFPLFDPPFGWSENSLKGGDLRACYVPCQYPRGLGSASPPGVHHLRQVSADATHRTSTYTCPLAFWPKPVDPCGVRLSGIAGTTQHLWLVLNDDVYRRFAYANHTTQSEPPTALVLAVATSSHDSAAIPGVQPACTELSGEGYTCPQSFTPHRYR